MSTYADPVHLIASHLPEAQRSEWCDAIAVLALQDECVKSLNVILSDERGLSAESLLGAARNLVKVAMQSRASLLPAQEQVAYLEDEPLKPGQAILVDPTTKTVSVVAYDDFSEGSLQLLYSLLGCEAVEAVHVGNGQPCDDAIFVDEEGLFNSPLARWVYHGEVGHHHELHGKGLIVGPADDEGNSLAPGMPLSYHLARITFI